MKLNTIREIAEKMSIDPGKMNKKELIRTIQEKEGYTPCFKTEPPSCEQFNCCWRDECKPQSLSVHVAC